MHSVIYICAYIYPNWFFLICLSWFFCLSGEDRKLWRKSDPVFGVSLLTELHGRVIWMSFVSDSPECQHLCFFSCIGNNTSKEFSDTLPGRYKPCCSCYRSKMGDMAGKIPTLWTQHVYIYFMLVLLEFCGIDLFGSWHFSLLLIGFLRT
jgi:hypothetical protein